MSFLDKLRQGFADTKAALTTKAAQFKNATFRDATMGICALVASADGNVSDDEKAAIGSLITSLDALKVFPPADLIAKFNEYVDAVNKDKTFGPISINGVIGKIKGKGEQPDVALQIALAIANADGNFDDSEKKRVREICRTLGLDAAQYVS